MAKCTHSTHDAAAADSSIANSHQYKNAVAKAHQDWSTARTEVGHIPNDEATNLLLDFEDAAVWRMIDADAKSLVDVEQKLDVLSAYLTAGDRFFDGREAAIVGSVLRDIQRLRT